MFVFLCTTEYIVKTQPKHQLNLSQFDVRHNYKTYRPTTEDTAWDQPGGMFLKPITKMTVQFGQNEMTISIWPK